MSTPSHIDNPPEDWEDLDEPIQDALIEFYNVANECITEDDLQLLADLGHQRTGSFGIFFCNECGMEHISANPNSWDSFQGAKSFESSNYEQPCCVRAYTDDDTDWTAQR